MRIGKRLVSACSDNSHEVEDCVQLARREHMAALSKAVLSKRSQLHKGELKA